MQPTDRIFPGTSFVLWKCIGQEARATGQERDKANESSLSFRGLTPCRLLCRTDNWTSNTGFAVSLIFRGSREVNANLQELIDCNVSIELRRKGFGENNAYSKTKTSENDQCKDYSVLEQYSCQSLFQWTTAVFRITDANREMLVLIGRWQAAFMQIPSCNNQINK